MKLFVSFPFKCYISTLVQNGMVQHTKEDSRCRYKYTAISISDELNIYTYIYLIRKYPEQILSTVIRHLTIVKQWSNKKSIGLIVFMKTNHISYNLGFWSMHNIVLHVNTHRYKNRKKKWWQRKCETKINNAHSKMTFFQTNIM